MGTFLGVDTKHFEKELRKLSGIVKRIKSQADKELRLKGGSFNKRMSMLYASRLRENIQTNKFKFQNKDEKYIKWKQNKGLPETWYKTGGVYENITFYKSGNGWTAGLKTFRHANAYALFVEYGTSKLDAMPLFGNTIEELREYEWVRDAREIHRSFGFLWKWDRPK